MQVGPHDEQDVLLKKSIHVLQQIQETVTVRHHTRTSLGWIHRAVFEREFGQRLCENLCSCVASQDKVLQKELTGLMSTMNETCVHANLVLTDEELLAVAAEAQFCLNDHELLGYALSNSEAGPRELARLLHSSSCATSDFITDAVRVRAQRLLRPRAPGGQPKAACYFGKEIKGD